MKAIKDIFHLIFVEEWEQTAKMAILAAFYGAMLYLLFTDKLTWL